MKVLCDAPVSLVPIVDLKLNPKNRNTHSLAQIERLAKILEAHGWRYPVKVSTRSGMVTSGHGRIMAAQKNGWKEVPVQFQDYATEEEEYADSIADNAIASWAELDLAGINIDMPDLGPNFDLQLLGLLDFKVDVAELPDLPAGNKSDFQQMTFTLTNDQADQVRAAMELAKSMGPFTDTGNENGNGNALARACELFVTQNADG